MSTVVPDLSQARMSIVRRLLDQAPDTAVRSLEAFLDGEVGAEAPSDAVRDMISAEREDRRLRTAVFDPLAPVFAPRQGLMRLHLPPDTPTLLWRALRECGPEELARAATAFADARTHDKVFGEHKGGVEGGASLILNALCREAAQGLLHRKAAYQGVLARFADQPQDLGALILLLKLTPMLRSALASLPAWMTARAGEYDLAIKDLVALAMAEDGQGGPMLMEALLGHMEQPAHILRLIGVVMDHPTDRLFALCAYASFGERLLDYVDAQIEIIRSFDPRRGLEGGVAAASASTLAHITLTEFEHNLILGKEGVWGGRIAAQRRDLALVMEMRLLEVEGAVSTALPATAVRTSGKPVRGAPDLTHAADRRAVDRAVGLVALVEGCRPSAMPAGYGAIRAKVLETLGAWLDTYTQDLLERLHKGGAQTERMRDYLDIAAELVAMVRGPEAAALIRRRVAAA